MFLKHFEDSIKHHISIPENLNIGPNIEFLINFLIFFATMLQITSEKILSSCKPNDLNNELNKELKSFSTEQYRVIDANEDNKLILVDGYAGSGKTVLALELARRKALEGKCIIFIFNRLIKNHIEDQGGLINEDVKMILMKKILYLLCMNL